MLLAAEGSGVCGFLPHGVSVCPAGADPALRAGGGAPDTTLGASSAQLGKKISPERFF